MLQILNWICFISICFLCLQVFIYMCKNTLSTFNNSIKRKKVCAESPVIANDIEVFEKKLAK